MTIRASPLRVCHVITGLATGGAEMMLYKLLATQDRSRFDALVISLVDEGTMGARLREVGVPVIALRMRRGVPSVRALLGLRRAIAGYRPHVIQGWMYHGNLAASLAAPLAGSRAPIVWNIRQTVYRLSDNSRATQAVIRLGAALSGRPAAVIYNSRTSSLQHHGLGFSRERTRIIANGFDLARFMPAQHGERDLRRHLGVGQETRIVGMIARYDPMKDFRTLIHAMARVRQAFPDALLVLAGRDVTPANAELVGLLRTSGLTEAARLLGEVPVPAPLMAGVDVVCSSSAWGEGFPNVLGEAMACGTPCVATEVGDSPYILGNCGITVPPRDPEAMATAIVRILAMPQEERRRLGLAARERVAANFSLPAVVEQYDALYHDVVGSASDGGQC